MDRTSLGNWLVIASVGIASLSSPATVQACRLFDCFGCFGCFGCCKKNSTPVTSYAPVVTTPVVAAPVVAAAPAASCGPAQCQQTVLRYVPQVAYRTVWQPVPVTTYRRTTSMNPTTGLPITCTQPCTTYTYQARRVPYTTFRPVYTTEPVTAPVATVPAPMAATVSPMAVATTAAPCSTCTPTTAGGMYAPTTTAPYYTPPVTTAPATPWTGVAPQSYTEPTPASPSDVPQATPWEPVPPGNGTPGIPNGTASPNNVPRGSTDPADQPPRIPPSINPNLNGSSLQRPATGENGSSGSSGNGNGNGSGNSGEARSGYTPSLDPYDGSRSAPTPWTTVRPEISTPPEVTNDPLRGNTSAAAPQSARPLPNVAAPETSTPAGAIQAPPLLNDPRDRTALRPIPARPRPEPSSAEPIPTRWASSRIAWPERPASYTFEVDTSAPAASAVDTPNRIVPATMPRRLEPQRIRMKRFDSDSSGVPASEGRSGWRSARR